MKDFTDKELERIMDACRPGDPLPFRLWMHFNSSNGWALVFAFSLGLMAGVLWGHL